MPQRLQNKSIVITGASKGIGRGIAQIFADEGAKVFLTARNINDLEKVRQDIQNAGGEAEIMLADVTDEDAMQKVFSSAKECYGKLDILINNAGIYPEARLENMTLAQWNHVIATNLNGTFISVKNIIPYFKDQGSGKIVVISSISGPKVGLPGYSHYTAAKSGVNGFIRTAAIELAKYKININAIEPGTIITEGVVALGEHHQQKMAQAVPLGHLGEPQDIAYAALFLASEEAKYITGQSLVIDGGQTLPESHFAEF